MSQERYFINLSIEVEGASNKDSVRDLLLDTLKAQKTLGRINSAAWRVVGETTVSKTATSVIQSGGV